MLRDMSQFVEFSMLKRGGLAALPIDVFAEVENDFFAARHS